MSADNFNSTVTSEYISSIGKIGNDKLLIILNIEKILTTTDMNIISESIKSEYMKAEVKRK
jgi:chemotaxis signal transduction protein